MKYSLPFGIILLLQLAHLASVFENSTSVCLDVSTLPAHEQCRYVLSNCDTDEFNIGTLNYLGDYYCAPVRAIPVALFCGVILACFVSLAVTASNYLCPNLYSISKFLELSDNLAGLTLLALGNGLADVISTFEALQVGATGLAISELLGAAFFILTVVVGAVSIVSPFRVPRMEFLRDTAFYVMVLLVTMCSLIMGRFNYYNSTLLLLIYVLYVIVVIYSHSLAESSFLTSNVARLRNQYDELWVEPTENVPEIREPTIDALVSQEELDEYSVFLKSVANNELHVPIETGSYGLKVLLKGLSKHTSKHAHGAHSPIHLTNERPLGAGSPIDEEQLETPEEEMVLLYRDIWRKFLPCYEDDAPFYLKLLFVLSYPANVALKLTTPNREEAINYIQTQKSTSFNFDALEESSVDNTSETISSNEFLNELRVFKIQFVLAPLWLAIYYFHKDKMFLLYLLLVLGVFAPISYFIPEKIPRFHLLLQAFKVWNYVGSFLGFVLSILWISMFATEIVAVLKALAVILAISDDIIGATVFAWGNSVGDLIANIMIAKMGMPLMAFGACFGGPLLAICSLGASAMITMNNRGADLIKVRYSSSLKINSLSLLVALVALVIGVPRNNWTFDKKIGAFLVGIWTLSVTAIVLVERF